MTKDLLTNWATISCYSKEFSVLFLPLWLLALETRVPSQADSGVPPNTSVLHQSVSVLPSMRGILSSSGGLDNGPVSSRSSTETQSHPIAKITVTENIYTNRNNLLTQMFPLFGALKIGIYFIV
jgi:hypothetical protein